MADTSSSCSGSCVAGSERSEHCPKRDGSQELVATPAHGRRGSSRALPVLRRGELPGGRTVGAARSRPTRALALRSSRAWPNAGDRVHPGAALPVRAVLRGADGRALLGAGEAALQRGGDRVRAGALGSAGRVGRRGATLGQPGQARGRGGGGGLGDAAALGARCSSGGCSRRRRCQLPRPGAGSRRARRRRWPDGRTPPVEHGPSSSAPSRRPLGEQDEHRDGTLGEISPTRQDRSRTARPCRIPAGRPHERRKDRFPCLLSPRTTPRPSRSFARW